MDVLLAEYEKPWYLNIMLLHGPYIDTMIVQYSTKTITLLSTIWFHSMLTTKLPIQITHQFCRLRTSLQRNSLINVIPVQYHKF